ncbi:SRPBCC family protein [Chitinophaga nivalis]|uniref:SRPBCC family protein n=1 Tax=Chitinophaga nivalis TaxID=2991709 RepID=A0ABT3IMP6_9BACT|nr:SRPBCC family protein [Chitinophaga nivalis]MCW3465086.1 SRPBCC family protein [Chitinophaga nivalis]MCW3485222.1 SRPBCC family protein [Chitinophaga nivalis]
MSQQAPSSHFAQAAMLIRKPVSRVFEAFIDPAVTTRFWFTKSSGKLVEGQQIEWIWEMYNHTIPVFVKTIVPDKTILISWGDNGETVEWTFTPLSDQSTFVDIVNAGIQGDTDKVIAQVRDSTEGFTLVLAGLKAYLEHHLELNLVADRFPKGLDK